MEGCAFVGTPTVVLALRGAHNLVDGLGWKSQLWRGQFFDCQEEVTVMCGITRNLQARDETQFEFVFGLCWRASCLTFAWPARSWEKIMRLAAFASFAPGARTSFKF